MEISEFIPFWGSLIRDPKGAFEKEKGKGGLGDAFRIVLAVSLVYSLLMGAAVLGTMMFLKLPDAPMWASGVFLFSLICGVLMFFVSSWIYYAVAKLLGGTGDYGSQTYLLSLIMPVSTVLSLVGGIVGFVVAMLCCFGSAISLAVSILIFYLYAVVISVEHKLDMVKAAVVIVIPAIVIGILIAGLVMFAVITWNLGVFNPSQPTTAAGFSAVRPVAWNFQGANYGQGNSLYATQATIAFSNIAGVDLTLGVNGKKDSENSIIRFSKPGASQCGWFGDVTVEDEYGNPVSVTWDNRYNFGKVGLPAGQQMVVKGLITGPDGQGDTSYTCGGPSGGIYRWTVTYQTALDPYGIQHSDSGTIIGNYQ